MVETVVGGNGTMTNSRSRRRSADKALPVMLYGGWMSLCRNFPDLSTQSAPLQPMRGCWPSIQIPPTENRLLALQKNSPEHKLGIQATDREEASRLPRERPHRRSPSCQPSFELGQNERRRLGFLEKDLTECALLVTLLQAARRDKLPVDQTPALALHGAPLLLDLKPD